MKQDVDAENQIRELITENDPRALELMYDIYSDRLYGYLLTILGCETEAEDVMQDLFMMLARKKGKLAQARNLTGYVFVAARNMAISWLRKRKHDTVPLEQAESILVDDTTSAGKRASAVEACAALMQLPLKQREVVSFKCLHGMTFDEISETLCISINTAASRYRYGIEKLKRILGASG